MSSEHIPFIGALVNGKTNQFLGTCIKEHLGLSVSRLNIEDNSFELEVNLKSAIDTKKLTSAQVHVVIGVDLEIKTNGNKMLPGTILDHMMRGRHEAVILPIETIIYNGKVNVIRYYVIPGGLVKRLTNPFQDTALHLSSDISILKNVKDFQDYNRGLREIYDLLQNPDISKFMSINGKQELQYLLQVLLDFKQNTFTDCFNSLQDLGTDNWYRKIHFLIESTENCRLRNCITNEELSQFRAAWKGKEKLIKTFGMNNIMNIVDATILHQIVGTEDVYVLFFCEDFIKNNGNNFQKTLDFFRSLEQQSRKSNKEERFIAVDLDAISKDELRIPLPNKITIYNYSNGELKSLDYMSDSENQANNNFARCITQGDENKPKMRGKFIMPCPNCFRGQCSMNYQGWVCSKCNNYIDFGFNNYLYCSCADGKGTSIVDFEFMCSDPKHGPNFVRFDLRCMDYFDQMKPTKNISIAILGQSGVGKSTWINGIVNYMQYERIEDAKENGITTAIPTKMYVTDENYKSHVINLGADDNEDTSNVGASGTQDCKTYCIRYKDYDIQLIDTPGVGDIRGIEQDRKNVKKFLDHLRHFEEINGICILLKPNESKFSILMEFCLKEILMHLHKTCVNNIVFCFTNSRSTFYRPGQTLPVLEKFLTQIQVDIPLNRNTIYCMDNEAYRYLCTLNFKGIKYSKSDERDFEQSWDKSVEETKRLLDYVIKLEPHTTQETTTLNQARKMVLSLARPVAGITLNIEMNIQAVNDQKQLIEKLDEEDEILLENLYESVETDFKWKSNLRKQKQEIIENLEKQTCDLIEKKIKILNTAGKFGRFLKTYALMPDNDSFEDYFDYLIEREERKGYNTEEDKAILKNLKQTKRKYEEEIEFLKGIINSASNSEVYDLDDVKNWAEELNQLPIHGDMLKAKVVLEAEENVVRHEQKNVAPPPVVQTTERNINSRVISNFANQGNNSSSSSSIWDMRSASLPFYSFPMKQFKERPTPPPKPPATNILPPLPPPFPANVSNDPTPEESPYNNSFGDYFDYLIDREERKGYNTEEDKAILKNLKQTQMKYEKEIEFLKGIINSASNSEVYDLDDVKNWAEELNQLPIHGDKLKAKVVLEAEGNVVRHEQKNVAPPPVVQTTERNINRRVISNFANQGNNSSSIWDMRSASLPFYSTPMKQFKERPTPPPKPLATNILPPLPPPFPANVSNDPTPEGSPSVNADVEKSQIMLTSPPKSSPLKGTDENVNGEGSQEIPKLDPMDGILEAIRTGVKLRKVEKKEQKEEQSVETVSSILKRRIPRELSNSDSDSASERKSDSEDWGETRKRNEK